MDWSSHRLEVEQNCIISIFRTSEQIIPPLQCNSYEGWMVDVNGGLSIHKWTLLRYDCNRFSRNIIIGMWAAMRYHSGYWLPLCTLRNRRSLVQVRSCCQYMYYGARLTARGLPEPSFLWGWYIDSIGATEHEGLTWTCKFIDGCSLELGSATPSVA